jgi:hypothetical protein
MKIKITLKDPDGICDAVDNAAEISARSTSGLSESEIDQIKEARRVRIAEEVAPWIDHGEYVRVEIDTEAGTATVLEAE